MSNAVLVAAGRLPSGAEFYRCALQVNPAHYIKTFRGETAAADEGAYITSVLDKCVAIGIRVLAITDHNHAGSVDRFRTEAASRDIHVFPGFEVESSEGIHVLCIYAPGTHASALERFLGELGIRNVDPSTTPCSKAFADVLECVKGQGGITIAAHVTQEKGLLHSLHGQARANAWKNPNLLAVQIPGSVDNAPEDKRPILKNTNPDYKREPAAADKLGVAVVNAKDVAKPEDLDDPGATCWIKMSEISIEGLRQAFLDPSSRIRLASDPVPEAHVEFRSLAWEGGFLDGASMNLNENLNVLIGGRGSGKTTVIESIRYVLGLDALAQDAAGAHRGIVQQVLKSGTKISMRLRVYRPTQKDYIIERTVPNPSVVRGENGDVLALSPSDVVPRAQVFGQHEISELTKNAAKLTQLLDRFVGEEDSLRSRKRELFDKLEASSGHIGRIVQERSQVEEKLAALPKLEETLRSFQEAGLEERLKEKSSLVREEQVLQAAEQKIAAVKALAVAASKQAAADLAFIESAVPEGHAAAATFTRLKDCLIELAADVKSVQAALEQAAAGAQDNLNAVKTEWGVRRDAVEHAYERILRDLQKSKVDGEEFIKLRRQIETLRPLNERRAALDDELRVARDERRRLVVEWEGAKAEEFRALERAAKKVTKRLDGRVRVQVQNAFVRDKLAELLRTLGGRLSEAIEVLRARDSLSLVELVEACQSGKETLAERFGLVPSQAERIVSGGLEFFMKLEQLDLPSATTVELNVAPEGDAAIWQKLEDLSTGQKATAVLLLLLLESDAPLVVDQPEDDLDNRFITESIVPRMREEKRRRQFIFATHNANIPVLGDAELIVGLTASGEAGTGRGVMDPARMGAIDVAAVKSMVEEVLEGGRAAFEKRRMKYQF